MPSTRLWARGVGFRWVSAAAKHFIGVSFVCPRCFAVTCNCGCAFCGWCMADCGNDAHAHVRQCPCSGNPGTFYGSVEQFEAIHREKRKNAVRQYLASLPSEDAAKVRVGSACNANHVLCLTICFLGNRYEQQSLKMSGTSGFQCSYNASTKCRKCSAM